MYRSDEAGGGALGKCRADASKARDVGYLGSDEASRGGLGERREAEALSFLAGARARLRLRPRPRRPCARRRN